MKRISYRLLAFVAVSGILISCGVREDRELCPCWLDFLLHECVGMADSLHICGVRSKTLFSDHVDMQEYPAVYEKEVDRGLVRTCVYTGLDRSVCNGYDVTIPLGEQADRLFVHRNTVDCSGETASDLVVLRKEWTTVNVRLEVNGEMSGNYFRSFRVVVHSSVNGTNMLDCSPTEGEFRYEPTVSSVGTFSFRLPRHEGAAETLFMDVYREGEKVDEMNLGKTFSQNGFSWNTPDLSDIDMKVDLLVGEVFITVRPWENLGHDHIVFQ